eukprot:7358364-Heterocapsa_arctica.AAC.1
MTWRQARCRVGAPGSGTVHLGSAEHPYLLLHKVAGQREIVEWLLTPQEHGFQKRFSVAFAPEAVPHDEDAPST